MRPPKTRVIIIDFALFIYFFFRPHQQVWHLPLSETWAKTSSVCPYKGEKEARWWRCFLRDDCEEMVDEDCPCFGSSEKVSCFVRSRRLARPFSLALCLFVFGDEPTSFKTSFLFTRNIFLLPPLFFFFFCSCWFPSIRKELSWHHMLHWLVRFHSLGFWVVFTKRVTLVV